MSIVTLLNTEAVGVSSLRFVNIMIVGKVEIYFSSLSSSGYDKFRV